MTKAPKEKDFKHEYPNTGFYLKAHQTALKKWADKAEERIKELEHFEATVIGLWATDRPDLIDDPEKIMFEITSHKKP